MSHGIVNFDYKVRALIIYVHVYIYIYSGIVVFLCSLLN